MQNRRKDEPTYTVAGEDDSHSHAAVAVEEGGCDGHDGEVEETAAEAVEEGLSEEEVPQLVTGR